ncbi:MAG: hypothetical protein D6729_09940 [Deltaproteobacteria bacterium]|nr:MAG: hypothetical protein D6729_09940 [Deltaproteobacteria bacterium]
MRTVVATLLTVLPGAAHAEPGQPLASAASTAPDPTRLFVVCAVLLLATAAAFYWARRRRRGWSSGLRIVEQLAIGKGRALVVVEYQSRLLLLGSTEGGIRVLHSAEAPVPDPAPEALPKAGAGSRFDALLADSLEQQRLAAKLEEAAW